VRSTDNGTSFDNVTSRTANHLSGVTFGNNTFVGVGNSGNIVRSTDNGSTWDNATSTTANHLYIVGFGNNTFVAAGYGGNIVRSTDNGTTWDNATSPTTNHLYGVTFGYNTFVAVGASGNIVRSTDNGITWDNVTSPTSKDLYGIGTSLSLMGGSIQGTELSLSTAVTTLAGTGSSGSADGTGTSASFYSPQGITTDGTNLYVVDTSNNLIRKIVISTGAVTTLAGSGSRGSANGTGTSASFYSPGGITTDGTNLYVPDTFNHLIRKIVISTGVVTTVAGTGSSGSADGTGTSASFYHAQGITTDGTNLYVADYSNHLIRKIVISTGAVTTLAGTGSSGSANGTGTSASFNAPRVITTDGTNLYVGDSGNDLIRQIVISTGVVTTVAGTGSSGSANGTGTSASFDNPWGITTDGTNLYVGDYGNHLIRKIE
jgi:hypothetical protein